MEIWALVINHWNSKNIIKVWAHSTYFSAFNARCQSHFTDIYFWVYNYIVGAKVDWDFRITDLVKNPDGTDF